MITKKELIQNLKGIIVGFLLIAVAAIVYSQTGGWVNPTTVPPGGNVPAPINAGSTAQTKSGDLTVQNLITNSFLTVKGGTPAVGKVLTSDANGLASWKPVIENATDRFVNEWTFHSGTADKSLGQWDLCALKTVNASNASGFEGCKLQAGGGNNDVWTLAGITTDTVVCGVICINF